MPNISQNLSKIPADTKGIKPLEVYKGAVLLPVEDHDAFNKGKDAALQAVKDKRYSIPPAEGMVFSDKKIRSLESFIEFIGMRIALWDAYKELGQSVDAFIGFFAGIPGAPEKYFPAKRYVWIRKANLFRDKYAVLDNATPEVSGFEELLLGLDSILTMDAGEIGVVYQNVVKNCLKKISELEADMVKNPSRNNHQMIVKYIEQTRLSVIEIKKSYQEHEAYKDVVKKMAKEEAEKLLSTVREVVYELMPAKAKDFQNLLLSKLGGTHRGADRGPGGS